MINIFITLKLANKTGKNWENYIAANKLPERGTIILF